MKRILSALSIAAALSSCSPQDITPPLIEEETLVPLELELATHTVTRAIVEGTTLPTASSVGITVRDSYGAYAGEEYTNIRRKRIPYYAYQMGKNHLRIVLINQLQPTIICTKSSAQGHLVFSFLHFRPLLPCSICFVSRTARHIYRLPSRVPRVFLLHRYHLLQS